MVQADHDGGVGRRGEGFHRKRLAVTKIRDPRRGVADVQFPAVFADRSSVKGDPKGSERLIGLAVVALQACLQMLRQRVILRLQRGPDCLNGSGIVPSGDVRMVHSPVGFAGPQSDVVQRENRLIGAAIDHGADAPVADRQGLLEKLRRTVVVQHQRPRLRFSGCSRTAAGQQQRGDAHAHTFQ